MQAVKITFTFGFTFTTRGAKVKPASGDKKNS
jgi:hypothetical protein